MAPILMNWKSTVIVSGAGLVATVFGWVSTPATIPQHTPPSRTVASPSPPAVSAAADIQHEAARLQTRVAPAPTFRQPSRNPFRFGQRVAPHTERATPPQLQATA